MYVEIWIRSKFGSENYIKAELYANHPEIGILVDRLLDVMIFHDNARENLRDKKSEPGKENSTEGTT